MQVRLLHLISTEIVVTHENKWTNYHKTYDKFDENPSFTSFFGGLMKFVLLIFFSFVKSL